MTENLLKTKNVSQLKQVVCLPEFEDAIADILRAKMFVELLEEQIEKWRKPLRDSYGFTEKVTEGGGKPTPVETHDDVKWVGIGVKDFDDTKISEYYDACSKTQKSLGYDVDDNCCILSGMEMVLKLAEKKLLDFMKEHIGMPDWKTMEDRRRMLELYIGLGIADARERGIDMHNKVMKPFQEESFDFKTEVSRRVRASKKELYPDAK